MVLKKVGYTHNKVAILTTQNASQLHLRGYPCQELSVRVSVLPDDGSEPKEVYIRRFLIQLGCGPHVEPKSNGENTRDDGEAGGQIAALLRVDTRSHSRQHLDEPSFTTCEPTCYRTTPNSQRSFGHIFCSPICCARSLKKLVVEMVYLSKVMRTMNPNSQLTRIGCQMTFLSKMDCSSHNILLPKDLRLKVVRCSHVSQFDFPFLTTF